MEEVIFRPLGEITLFFRWESFFISEKRVCLSFLLLAGVLATPSCLSSGPLTVWGSSEMIYNQSANKELLRHRGLLMRIEELKELGVWLARWSAGSPGWEGLFLNIVLCRYLGHQASYETKRRQGSPVTGRGLNEGPRAGGPWDVAVWEG